MAVIEWDKIGEVIWVSLVAGICAVSLFSLVVYASSRASEARRSGGSPAAFGAMATGGMILFLGIIAVGIWVILDK